MDPERLATGARVTAPVPRAAAVVAPLRAEFVVVVAVVLLARATGPRATNLTSREV